MEVKEELPCIVWNADEDVWVLPSTNDLEPGTFPTIAEVVQKIGAPINIRYPGNKETIEAIH